MPKKRMLVGLVTALLFGVFFVTNHPASALTDLVGYWNFEEKNGTVSADVSGTGNSGTFVGNGIGISTQVPPTTCYVNERSLHFSGDGSYVNVPDTPSMDPDYISIAFWVKPDAVTSSYQHIIFKQRIPGMATSYGVWLSDTGRPYAEFSDGGASGLAATTSLTVGTWNYVAVTYDGSDINMYVNGVHDAHRTYANGPIQYGGHPLKIGHGDYNSAFQGNVDDLRIYNRALTTSEVANIYAGGCGPGVAPADDGDGITEAIENGAPNGGDGNNDGIADASQANVTSFVNAVSGGYTTLELDDNCSVTSVSAAADTTNSVSDKGYTYPTGMINFSANCGVPGYTTSVKLYIYGAQSGLTVRKYNDATKQYATIGNAVQTSQVIGAQTVQVISYSVTDGGSLDTDGVVNGSIVDPVGLAQALPGVPDTGVNQIAIGQIAIITAVGVVIIVGCVVKLIQLRRYQ